MTSQMREDEDESKRETSDSEFKLNQLELDKELLLHQERLQQLLDQGDSESFLEDPQLMQPLPAALAGKNQITLKPCARLYATSFPGSFLLWERKEPENEVGLYEDLITLSRG